MNVAVVTFVYNESINLPIWRRYYGGVFGEGNLFVIDHGSTDGSTENLGSINKLALPREELDEHKRCVFMASFQRGLLEYFDTVIYTDCDEIIVPDLTIYKELEDYLERTNADYIAPIGLNVQHVITHEGPLDLSRPVLEQRQFCKFSVSMCKPQIAKIPLTWATGFHACNQPIKIDQSLFMFHLKCMDYGISFARHALTKEMRWAESSLAANHGAHSRYDYPRFVRKSFLDALNIINTRGLSPFEFGAEIEKIQAETEQRNGIFYPPQIEGKIAEIPEYLRRAF